MRARSTVRNDRSGNASVPAILLIGAVSLFSLGSIQVLGARISDTVADRSTAQPVSIAPPRIGMQAMAGILTTPAILRKSMQLFNGLTKSADWVDELPDLATRVARNDASLDALNTRRSLARDHAAQEVATWSDETLVRNLWEPGQRDDAIRARGRQLFGRHDRRMRNTHRAIRDLLEQESAATTAEEIARLQGMQESVLRAGRMNWDLGTEKSIPLKLTRMLQLRATWLADRVGLARDNQFSRGHRADDLPTAGALAEERLDPIDSTMWEAPKTKRTTPEALYEGPWMRRRERPTVPDENTTLMLRDFRSMDADGGHPSVFVRDPATGLDWKMKFLGKSEKLLDTEAVKSRLFAALGFDTQPIYSVTGTQRVAPGAVLAAFEYKNRIGFRVSENGVLHRWLRIKPGKYGSSPYKMRDFVRTIGLKDGRVLEGAEAHRTLKRSANDVDVRASIEYVEVDNVTLTLKGDNGRSSIGPFSPDADDLVNTRAMAALAIIDSTWLGGDDIRFNNLKLLVERGDDGELRFVHSVNDIGSGLSTGSPNAFARTTGLDPDGLRLHADHNRYTLDAYDRITRDDMVWAIRKVAELDESQIQAAVASGTDDYAVVTHWTETLLARRDDLVRKAGLEQEVGLLRPDGPLVQDADGTGSIVLMGNKKKHATTVTFRGQGQRLLNGELIPAE